MFCPNCGSPRPDQAAQCHCGYSFVSSQMAPAVVPFGHTLASLGARIGGQFLDSLVVTVVLLGTVFFGAATDGWWPFVGAMAFGVFYLLFADGFAGGQSWGKRAFGTAVIVEQTGEPCNFWKSFIRNLPLAFLGFIDWLFIFGQKRQRLGDKLAGTIVIKQNAASR